MIDFLHDYIFRLIDGIIACMSANLSWHYLSTTFWFLIFIEFPRYYLVDIIVAIRHGLTWRRRRDRNALARRKLFLEHPLVSILVPGKNEGPNIYQLVKSLAEQTYDNYEIVIVDDGSDDNTLLICEDLKRAGLIDKFFRLRKHIDIILPTKNFSFLNALSNLENLVFDLFFNYLWVFYMFTLIFSNTDRLLDIFIVAYLIRLSFSIVSFTCQQAISERSREERHMLVYLLLHTFYVGYFLRLTRLVGHTQELLLRTSYKDPWNPGKTSEVALSEGL